MFEESGFPPLYARWLQEILGAPVPSEGRATCGDCPMRRDLLQDVSFSKTTKCCTFFPELPSFSVGRLLADQDPSMAEGRARVRARIEAGQQVTPLGISRPTSYYSVYGMAETFGVADSLRCPFYIEEGGLCGVWRHRESTCCTWYCKHERGAVGFQFWTAARLLLKGIEQRLARAVAEDLRIEPEALDALLGTPHTLDRQEHPELFAAVWGDWAGREVDYYLAAGRAVGDLGWDEVRERCGDALDERLANLHGAFEHLEAPARLPELVRIRPLRRAGGDGQRTLVASYSKFDPVEMPAATVDALQSIDGKPVAVILDQGAAAGIDRPLLERLWEFGLIEDAFE